MTSYASSNNFKEGLSGQTRSFRASNLNPKFPGLYPEFPDLAGRVRVKLAELRRHVPHLGPRVSPSLTYTRAPSQLSFSLPFTPQLSVTLSLSTPSHGGASPSPPPLNPLHLAGASSEEADELHRLDFIFFLGARSFPKLHLHLLPPLPQASSKKDDLELHQALYTILKPLPVFHSSPVSLSHPRSTPIAIWKP